MATPRHTRRRLLKWFAAAAATGTVGGTMIMPRKANAYYAGPVSDHFDGTRFINLGGRGAKSFGQLARLFVLEPYAPWPERVEALPPVTPPRSVEGLGTRITHIGHASWLIQAAGLNILVDPVWSDRASPVPFLGPRRANPPGVRFEELPPIHVVLVTHNHYDHLDVATLARLWQRDRPHIVTPLGNDTIMRNEIPDLTATAVDWGDVTNLSPVVRLYTEPSQHWSARGFRDRMHALWASFVIETPAGRIYAIGDTGFGDGRTFRHIRDRDAGLRLAWSPIGAYAPRWFMADQHINPSEAVAVFEAVQAELALGHHWGTFRLTAEAHDDPPADLARALAARGILQDRFRPAQPGLVTTI